MNNVTIKPNPLTGKLVIPPSKSISHRGVIAAGLADGISYIYNVSSSEDLEATIQGMRSIGAQIELIKKHEHSNDYEVRGAACKNSDKNIKIDANESGSTLRFLIPIALFMNKRATFTGRGKLMKRPLEVYFNIFDEHEIDYIHKPDKDYLKVNGQLQAGDYRVPGNVSSQFISGLLFSLPLCKKNSTITVLKPVESIGYIDLTLDILNKFGIDIINNDYTELQIPGNQGYNSCNIRIEGDYSQAAFWMVAGTIGKSITIKGLDQQTKQGDRVIIDIINQMGGSISQNSESLVILPKRTTGRVIDVSQCPDLVPVLAVLATFSEGQTKIINAQRLKIKESNRLKAIATELNKIGGKIIEQGDSLLIDGVERLSGGCVDSWNDHRIVMALSIASIRCEKSLKITNSGAIKKSYPTFFSDFKKLGGVVYEQ